MRRLRLRRSLEIELEQDILIGKIAGPFGIGGEVKVTVLTDFPERFEKGRSVRLKPARGPEQVVKVQRSRAHKGGLVVKFEGADTREAAESLRDASIVIGRAELAELESGSYYVFDIIGLEVVSEDGRECGEVVEVLQGGANDVYVTSTGLCIPALKDVVSRVDLAARRLTIRPVPGLLPED